jgi:hypothetical protein
MTVRRVLIVVRAIFVGLHDHCEAILISPGSFQHSHNSFDEKELLAVQKYVEDERLRNNPHSGCCALTIMDADCASEPRERTPFCLRNQP